MDKNLHIRLFSINRNLKRWLMVFIDVIALTLALWSGYALRLTEWWPYEFLLAGKWLFITTPVIGVFVFARLGLYRAVLRFIGPQAIWAVFKGIIIVAIAIALIAYFTNVKPFSRSVPINFALAGLLYVGGSRMLLRFYYNWLIKRYIEKEPVLIYGAGGAGVQLLHALNGGAEFIPVGFVDDEPQLWKSSVAGLEVYSPENLHDVIKEYKVTHLLLALPNLTASRKRIILEKIAHYPVHVKTIPGMPELISGESIGNLRDVKFEDLLGRDVVPPKAELIESSLKGKSVLVTGAGGSIGSEIARQVLANGADKLILFELSEYALYQIDMELRSSKSDENDCEIYPILGSVLDSKRIGAILKQFSINTVYHAAAYKHVPMVEHNTLEGVRNNFIGTLTAAKASAKAGVERFILISTDKAVRPTNIMGASKRSAEMALQNLAAQKDIKTIFSMVRFGNVLGSSGSVVPLFTRQIKHGGPVTVTHQDITRYFMTIPEATSLVIQAGSLATGGEVFLLDMGEPVKILDLARRMIHLMGMTIKDETNPEGDIAITFRGLRPGEKLYEELLIGDNVTGTAHPKIMRAEEAILDDQQFSAFLAAINKAIDECDTDMIRRLLVDTVSGFKPMSDNVDWLNSVNQLKLIKG